jgi:hypothetical protein
MDVSSTAALAALTRQAEFTQALSLVVVKQKVAVEQAVVQLLAEANQRVSESTGAVDITV